jgi:hypothetical protein
MAEELTDDEIREIARDLGISEEAARSLLAAVEAEANPPPGKLVTV